MFYSARHDRTLTQGTNCATHDGGEVRERWFPTIIHYEEWDDEVIAGDAKYSHQHGCWLVRDNGDDPLIYAHPFDSDAAGFNNT